MAMTSCFLHGVLQDYEGVQKVDMVVTLHACDKATDYALAKAVEWDAQVILSVPCCQHELNSQIHNELLEPVLKYGILKERISALLTDGIRAELLEAKGYSTQILEFIDMEHTPKNLLIRAVKNEKAHFPEGLPAMNDALNSHLTLEKLLYPDGCTLRRESETMLKVLKRFLILLAIFILGVTGTVFLMNNETTDDRSDMNNPTLPGIDGGF